VPEIGSPDHAPHDLRVPGTRQFTDDVDPFRTQRLAESFGDAVAELLDQPWRLLNALPELAEDHERLTFHRIGNADGSGFLDSRVGDGDRFDFGRAEALASDLERVVRAAEDVPEAIGIDQCPVTVDPEVRPA